MAVSGARAVAGDAGNYRIEVADFGPIRRADVDLRPLTVFAGPSNTGKSYLAMLVYALHQCFSPSSVKLPPHRRPHWFIFSGAMAEPLLGDRRLRQRMADWWSTGDGYESAPPDDVAKALRSALEQVSGGERFLAEEVRRCFGVDALSDLVRKGSASTDAVIALHVAKESGQAQTRYRIELGSDGLHVSGKLGALPRVSRDNSDERFREWFTELEDSRVRLRWVLDRMFESLIRPLIRRSYYLPADRTRVMHSHQVVVSTLVRSATTAGIRPSANVPLLSGVLADFLDGLIGMSQRPRAASGEIADTLEQNLLAGIVRLNRSETGYPSFVYRPANWESDMPLMRTASMVSELAPVVLFLRHLVESDDLLIIEEPESHLHPALQTTFVRELARLVHSGIHVMLTTHSEWIMEALANLVRSSELSEEQRKGIPGADVALTPDQVGAWLFRPDADGTGSLVAEIPLDTEAGTFPVGFGEVTESLYNEWARIGNRIAAGKTDRND